MRLSFIKSLLALKFDSQEIKKYVFILNICIFVCISALISTGISVYYQSKINKNDQLISDINTNKRLLKLVAKFTNDYENYINKALVNFRYDRNFSDLVADNTTNVNSPSRSRERFFISVKNFISSYDVLDRDMKDFIEIVKDLDELVMYKAIRKKDLDRIYNLQKKSKKNLDEIFNLTKSDLILKKKDFFIFENKKKTKFSYIYHTEPKEIVTIKKKDDGQEYLIRKSEIDYNRYFKITKKLETFVIDYQFSIILLNKILLDLDKWFATSEEKLNKSNSELAKKSSQTILAAFFLQLLVFIFINFFEISTYRNEEK